jgi:hypothetical protein
MSPDRRLRSFAVLAALCLCVSAGYVWLRTSQITAQAGSAAAAQAAPPVALPETPYVLFRSSSLGDGYGQVATLALDNLAAPRTPSGLVCERVDFSAGYGVCLGADRGSFTSYYADFFEADLRPRRRLQLQGIPSRTRVSPDGRHAAITVFVSGHSYAPGSFSTSTTIYRTADGAVLGELEQFAIERDGKLFREVDFNFWGVTFAADGNRFYATLASGGQNYLVEGDLAARRARVIHSGVECPSLSPDERRIAFKRLTSDGWHIFVLDLQTGVETALSEARSVDDQVEWLDNRRVLYALGEDIWVMAADGSGRPAVYLADAYSPAVIRQGS